MLFFSPDQQIFVHMVVQFLELVQSGQTPSFCVSPGGGHVIFALVNAIGDVWCHIFEHAGQYLRPEISTSIMKVGGSVLYVCDARCVLLCSTPRT